MSEYNNIMLIYNAWNQIHFGMGMKQQMLAQYV